MAPSCSSGDAPAADTCSPIRGCRSYSSTTTMGGGRGSGRVSATKGIPVAPASSVAELEGWPVGKVVVTHAASSTPLWFEMGAAHVVVLADSDEERALASGMTHERATVAKGDPAALLASLRTIAKSNAVMPSRNHTPERRSGPAERRRHPGRDRRS